MSPPRPDLATRSDVLDLLDEFYRHCFADDLLGPVFLDVAHMDLAAHLPAIADFWCKVALHQGEYRRNALAPHKELHRKADLTPQHFERWLAIWRATVDRRHVGPHADLARIQGTRIAYSMCRTITGTASARIGELLQASGHRARSAAR